MWSGEFDVSLRKLQGPLVEVGAEVSRPHTSLLQAGSRATVRSIVTQSQQRRSIEGDLPEGWSVSELSVVRPPSGTPIRAWFEPRTDGGSLQSLADELEVAARAELGHVDVIDACDLEVAGSTAHARQLHFERDGTAMTGRIACTLLGEMALVVAAAWPRNDGLDVADEVDTVIARWLADGESTRTTPADETATIDLPEVTVGDLDRETWAPIVAAWSTVTAPATVQHRSTWSPEELSVASTFAGPYSFPTVGFDWSAGLSDASLDAVIDATTRSLLARAALVADGQLTALAPGLDADIAIALRPEVIIDVVTVRGATASRHWFGVLPSSAIQITVLGDGTRRLDRIDPHDVAAAVLAVIPGSHSTPTPSAPPVESITMTQLVDEGSAIEYLTQVTTTWKCDGRRRAGVLLWAGEGDGDGWLAEPNAEGTWSLHTSAGLLPTLLAHLPYGLD
jgi:hypothetical protein